MNYELREKLHFTIKTAVVEFNKELIENLIVESRGSTALKQLYRNYVSLLFDKKEPLLHPILESILFKMFAVFRNDIMLTTESLQSQVHDYALLLQLLNKNFHNKRDALSCASLFGKLVHWSLPHALFSVGNYQYYFRSRVKEGKEVYENLADAFGQLKADQEPTLEEVLAEIDIESLELAKEDDLPGREYVVSDINYSPRRLEELFKSKQ